jgi:hypothetical protein
VEQVEAAVDQHDAVLAGEAVGAAGVEVLEDEEVVAGELGEHCGEVSEGSGAEEVVAAVKA